MSVPPLSKSIGWTRGITEGRNMMLDLQRQLATGRKAATYGGLGPDAAIALTARSRLSAIEAFRTSNDRVDLRLKMMTQVLDRFVELGREVRSDALMPSYDLSGGSRTSLQVRAETALDEALSLMRTDVAGRYLFSGAAVDTNPVASKAAIMDGEGGKAGFKQVLAERKAADLGNGLGRLELERTDAAVSVAEDHDGPFGFKIVALQTDIGGAAASGPAGTPQQAVIDFENATPNAGDVVRMTVALPDGTERHVVLTVAADGEGAAEPGRFEAGATPEETAENFRTALEARLERTAAVDLAAASGFAAGEDFFNYGGDDGPRRVNDDGDGFRDGSGDTVLWYRGDTRDSDPRQSVVARVDQQIEITYGARANEEALRTSIQSLAVLAAERFDEAVGTDKLRYEEMTQRAANNLSTTDGRQTPQAIQAHLAAQHHTLGKANERHTAMKGMAQELLASVEEADPHEVAVKLLQLQTRLEASYQTTAMLSKMSLVYYM